MSLEAIKNIGAAEAQAQQSIIKAKELAIESIENAGKSGKDSIAKSIAHAEAEIAELTRSSDQKAAEQAMELASATANRTATLRARSESRLDKTAALIAERIVNI